MTWRYWFLENMGFLWLPKAISNTAKDILSYPSNLQLLDRLEKAGFKLQHLKREGSSTFHLTRDVGDRQFLLQVLLSYLWREKSHSSNSADYVLTQFNPNHLEKYT